MHQEEQTAVCRRTGAKFVESQSTEKLGIAMHTIGRLPINGLRHPPEAGTCGWYVWCGEEGSAEPHFFQSIHVSHVADHLPQILPYLGLEPGFRFLIAPGHEDVWFDEKLLKTAP
jgi:hypothetical protein